jgi:transcription elongation factor GreB
MSRGFVKEDDQEEAPFIPPRAPLPDGVPNYVTPRGLLLLHAERESLEAALHRALADDDPADYDRRRIVAEHDGRMALLNERIVPARVVEATGAPCDEARFGNRVRFIYLDGPQTGSELAFTIVGVDESNVKEGRIAFTSPIAKALIGKRERDVVEVVLGGRTRRIRIEVINSCEE